MQRFALALALALALGLPALSLAAGVPKPKAAPASPAAAMDGLLTRFYKADQPGAAVLVMKEGKILFEKGYGLANVEHGVPVKPDRVFRIASITKQFTAAAVLKLAEEGKVELQAPVGRYLKGLPPAWEKASVEQLLNHTSGIPSFTQDQGYKARMREDLSPAKSLDRVRSKAMDFEPGTNFRYNNSGYVMLGMLVEQVSGQSYQDFLQKAFFEPLGLKGIRYGHETTLIPRMVSGYTEGPNPAPYLSMTQPFSAGGLVSTVEDLARWTEALHAGKVVKPESLARMTTPTRTRDGKETPYGYGLAFFSSQGRVMVGHNGGINGFSTGLWMDPRTKAVAVILNNSDRPAVETEFLSLRLLAMAAGTPIPEPKAVAVEAEKLARLAGRYKGQGAVRTIRFEGGRLLSQVGASQTYELIPLSETEFAFPDSDVRLRFVIEGGQVAGVHRMDYEGEGPIQKRMEAQDERQAVVFDPAAFDAFAGQYELAPGFVLKFWREGGRFLTQATGQPQTEIFPASSTRFFLKVVDAEVEFVEDGSGKVNEVILFQGGQKRPAKRIP